MKRILICVTLLIAAVSISCNRQDDNATQENTEQTQNQIIKDACISDMTDLVHQLQVVANDIQTGTRTATESTGEAELLVDQLSGETRTYLEATGWTQDDLAEMDSVEGIDEVYALYATELVAANGGLTDGIIPIPGPTDGTTITTNSLTWGEVGQCALSALGVDFVYGSGAAGAAGWTIAAIKVAFKAVAKTMLGPIGVGLAVGWFAGCLGYELCD